MKSWQIRWRLTFWNTLVLMLILVSFASAMLWRLRVHLNQRDDNVLVEELHELLEEYARLPAAGDRMAQLEQRFDVHSHYYFQVLTAQQKLLFQSRFLSQVSLPPAPEATELRGPRFADLQLPRLGHYRLLTQAFRDASGEVRLVRVLTPRAALDREFEAYLWIAGGLLLLCTLVACVSGYLLARWALDPVNRIISTARRISADTLSERLEVPDPRDELGRLALTLNQMFDRLQHSLEQMRRFTADAAHELRSPLAVMQTEAEVMLRHTRTVDVYQRAMAVNLEETRRLGDLVDQLLTLSRHDEGAVPVQLDEVPVSALIQDVGERLQSLADTKNLQLELQCDPHCLVQGDDVALSQLFFNLLENALKYTPAGGRVRMTAADVGDRVEIVVADTGPGIAAEHLPHIFERFYRTDSSRHRDFGGAGLGLAICKSIVHTHGGQIQVDSQPGTGTRFTILLPKEHENLTREKKRCLSRMS